MVLVTVDPTFTLLNINRIPSCPIDVEARTNGLNGDGLAP